MKQAESSRWWIILIEIDSNAAKTQNQLKFAGVPQTTGWISPLAGRSSPYCGDMWRTYRCLTGLFPVVDTCLSCEDIARQSCAMVPRWRFLATFLQPAFPASCVQQVSDLRLKFALRPHHVWKYGRYPIYGRWDRATIKSQRSADRSTPLLVPQCAFRLQLHTASNAALLNVICLLAR